MWCPSRRRIPVGRELLATHVGVAVLTLLVTALFAYASFRSDLLVSQGNVLRHQAAQVARVMQGYFTGELDAPTADYLLSGLAGALDARLYVVDPLGQVILWTGRAPRPPAAVPAADLRRVLIAGRAWSGVLGTRAAYLAAGVPITLAGEVVGGVFMEEPLGPVLARAGNLLARQAAGGLLAVLVAALLAWQLSRRLARPLIALQRAADAAAQGRLDQQVVPSGPSEVHALAERFNQMARAVADLVADLKREAALRDELLAHVAHDLKTPLTVIRGYLEAIRDGVITGADAETALAVAGEETVRLQRLVGRLLDAARLEATLRAQTAPVAVVGWIQDLIQRVAPLAAKQDVTVTVTGPSETSAVWPLDAATEVMLNVLTNAVQWSPPRGRVTVEVRPGPRVVTLTVDDEGPGVAPELLDRLFRPFVTGETARGGGTGLGLAIAARLTQAMGGRIAAVNRAPHGLRITLTWPRDVRAALSGVPDASAVDADTGGSAGTGGSGDGPDQRPLDGRWPGTGSGEEERPSRKV